MLLLRGDIDHAVLFFRISNLQFDRNFSYGWHFNRWLNLLMFIRRQSLRTIVIKRLRIFGFHFFYLNGPITLFAKWNRKNGKDLFFVLLKARDFWCLIGDFVHIGQLLSWLLRWLLRRFIVDRSLWIHGMLHLNDGDSFRNRFLLF